MELGWLAAACGRRMWRWGGGPGAARPSSDESAGVVLGECGRRVWDRDGHQVAPPAACEGGRMG
jgi:hypothetical protein